MNLVLILALLSGVVADDFELPPDIVYSTTNISGTMLGFQAGDYIQAMIQQRGGEPQEYWSFDPLLDYFLASHVGETVTLTVEDVDTYLVEMEEVVRIFRITDASAGGTAFTEWRDSLQALGDPEDLLGDYEKAPLEHLYGTGSLRD